MNTAPRDLQQLLHEELDEARKKLKYMELDADGKTRQEGVIAGIELGIGFSHNLVRLAGMAAGLVRVAELCGKAPSALRVIKGGGHGLEGEQKA